MKRQLIFLLLVLPIVIMAKNSQDDTLVTDFALVDTVEILPDDPILLMLDNMLSEKFFEANPVITDTHLLDKVGFCPDSVPKYDSEYYKSHLELLDAATPFELAYNSNVEAFINLYAVKKRELTSRILGLSHMYFPMFEEILDKHNLPLEFKYLAVVESALKPNAKSGSGAVGLWQFMYRTGRIYHLNSDSYIDDRQDPYLATEAACEYFKFLYSLYGNWELVMAAYNCGPGNVNKAIRRSGGKKDYWSLWPYLPRETRGYVPAFIAVNYVMSNASAHNLYPTAPLTTYFEYDTVYVTKEVSLEQISQALDIEPELLSFINPRYKTGLIPLSQKPNVLYLPHDKIGLFLQNEETVYNFNKPSPEEQKEEEKEKTRVQESTAIHIVRNGEYLGLIANKYHVKIQDIKQWNNLTENSLKIGQKLVIYVRDSNDDSSQTPAPEQKEEPVARNGEIEYYTVNKGDTLWDIANAKGISVSELKELNSGLNFKRLQPGTKIVIKPGS